MDEHENEQLLGQQLRGSPHLVASSESHTRYSTVNTQKDPLLMLARGGEEQSL